MNYLHLCIYILYSVIFFSQLTISSFEFAPLNLGNSFTVAMAIDVFATLFGYRPPDFSTNRSTIKLWRWRRFFSEEIPSCLHLFINSSAPLFLKCSSISYWQILKNMKFSILWSIEDKRQTKLRKCEWTLSTFDVKVWLIERRPVACWNLNLKISVSSCVWSKNFSSSVSYILVSYWSCMYTFFPLAFWIWNLFTTNVWNFCTVKLSMSSISISFRSFSYSTRTNFDIMSIYSEITRRKTFQNCSCLWFRKNFVIVWIQHAQMVQHNIQYNIAWFST